MWVVRAVGGSPLMTISLWARGGDGLFVYGTKEAAEKSAQRINATDPRGFTWEAVELPGLLVEARDELHETLIRVEAVLAQMREAGQVALWPAAQAQDEKDKDDSADGRPVGKLTN